MEWLLTYVVHSTALIAAVWLVSTVVPKITLGTKETLWKIALLGPLATASIHQVGGVPSVWGELPMPQALRTADAPVAAAPVASANASSSEAVVERRVVRHRAGELQITTVRQRPAQAVAAAPTGPVAPQSGGTSPWPIVLLSLWGVGAVLAVGRLVWAASRLRKQLEGRRDVIEDPVLESFLHLCDKAGLKKRPRLTASPHLRSPIALGRREICLPERAVDSLTPAQQQAMLGHEMAHLLRRDPLWTVAIATIEALFFFQPLNHVARRKIQEVAELQCDDWAAQQAGTGVHLAKCLAEVAGWVEDGPPVSPTVTAMADRESPIVRRITRLLNEQRKGGRVHPVGRMALTLGTLGLVVALVPGVSQAEPLTSAAPSPSVIVLAQADAGARPMLFEDRSDSGHDRSRLRLHTGNEVVEIEVQAPRSAPPPPPPPSSDRVEIRVHGHFGGLPWWGGSWGVLGLDMGGLEMLFGDADDLSEHLYHLHHHSERAHAHAERARERAHHRAERARERAGRARERAERHVERALRQAERARERAERHWGHVADDDDWTGLFGVSFHEDDDDDDDTTVITFEL